MLFDIEGFQITSIPHKVDYDRWMNGITQDQHDKVIETIHKAIDGKDIFNASFIPGAEWEGTPFMPLYEACDRDVTNAAYFYGILCWLAVQSHSDEWICYKNSESNIGRGWTYFRKRKVRPLSFEM